MAKPVKIEDRKVTPMFYQGRPVVTLRMVDEFHGRVERTALRNFKTNRKHFIEGEDFFMVPYEEWKELLGGGTAVRNSYGGPGKKEAGESTKFVGSRGGIAGRNSSRDKQRNPMIFLTETGYLMVVKSLTDDKAWAIHRAMVKAYFNKRMGYKKPTDEEIAAFNTDILTLGTKGTAEKYSRSESCIKKYTTETRAGRAVQLSLFE
ncbi:MAG: ORF6N domain-containing protein [Desulfocapsa sp.]|nr:ORF6N domain-containing protein [Desulfocapsa sp.]